VQDVRHGGARRRLSLNGPITFARRFLLPRLAHLRAAHPDFVLSMRTQPRDALSRPGSLDAAIRFATGDWQALHGSHLFQEALQQYEHWLRAALAEAVGAVSKNGCGEGTTWAIMGD